MRSNRRIAVALMVPLVAAAASVGCRGSSGDDPRTLTLYSGQHAETTARLVAAFEKQTGFEVNVRTDDEAVLANDIAGAGAKRSADVIYTENTPPLRLLEIKRLLAPVPAATMAKVDYRWRSTAGDWVGVSARIMVMDYNTEKVQPTELPTSVMDLAEPDWKGKIGIAPRDTDFQSVVTAVLRTHGEERTLEWLHGIKANAGSYVYSDNAVLGDAINRGQVELGLVNHYSWFRERAKVGAAHMRSMIAFLRPLDPGYLLDISGAAVVRTSHSPAAAQKLVAFLVSRAGAKIIAEGESYEYPLGSNVKAAKGMPEFNALQPTPLSFNDLGDGTRAVELLREVALI